MTAREVVLAYIRWAALDEARRRETDALPTPRSTPVPETEEDEAR